MSASVTRLPTAAATYLRVVKRGRGWAVELVTPVEGGGSLVTKLVTSPSRSAAIAHAERAGHGMQRPLRLPREGRP